MYFYAISRRDLSSEQQAIQAAHAVVEYIRCQNPDLPEHPTFIFLTAADTKELVSVYCNLKACGIKVQSFSDPDFDWGNFTAVAALVPEDQRFLLSGYPLWKASPAVKAKVWFRKLLP